MKNLSNLRHSAMQHKAQPSDKAWHAIQHKLENSKQKKQINHYKSIAIAAIMVAVLSVSSLLVWQNQDVNTVQGNQTQYSLHVLDHVNIKTQGIYEIPKLRQLKDAYAKMTPKTKI